MRSISYFALFLPQVLKMRARILNLLFIINRVLYVEEIVYIKHDNSKRLATILLILLILYLTLGPTTFFPVLFIGSGEGKHGNLEIVFEPRTIGRNVPSTIVFTLAIKNPTGSQETLETGVTRFFVKVYGLDSKLIEVSGGETTLVLHRFIIKPYQSLMFDHDWGYCFNGFHRSSLVLLPGAYRITAQLDSLNGAEETTSVLMIILP
jgi:hypothetical protein